MILDIAIQLLIQDQKFFNIKYITAIPIALLYSASKGLIRWKSKSIYGGH